GQASAPLPPSPPTIHGSMDEYRFAIADETVPAGRVVFSMANVGQVEHRLSLIPLPADFPPIEQQVQSPERRFVEQLAAIPPTSPGEEAAFAVDLQPGRYGIACFMVAPDGTSHAEKGMVAEFRVG
ncbi:MAG TPA: hypothetical protein VG452_05770, partial [Egibacteraceae bacterium]|nr:hypothetical protein [Egibacteraceae bacterium]